MNAPWRAQKVAAKLVAFQIGRLSMRDSSRSEALSLFLSFNFFW